MSVSDRTTEQTTSTIDISHSISRCHFEGIARGSRVNLIHPGYVYCRGCGAVLEIPDNPVCGRYLGHNYEPGGNLSDVFLYEKPGRCAICSEDQITMWIICSRKPNFNDLIRHQQLEVGL